MATMKQMSEQLRQKSEEIGRLNSIISDLVHILSTTMAENEKLEQQYRESNKNLELDLCNQALKEEKSEHGKSKEHCEKHTELLKKEEEIEMY